MPRMCVARSIGTSFDCTSNWISAYAILGPSARGTARRPGRTAIVTETTCGCLRSSATTVSIWPRTSGDSHVAARLRLERRGRRCHPCARSPSSGRRTRAATRCRATRTSSADRHRRSGEHVDPDERDDPGDEHTPTTSITKRGQAGEHARRLRDADFATRERDQLLDRRCS